MRCHVQGHNLKTCKWEGKKQEGNQNKRKDKGKAEQIWVQKETENDRPVIQEKNIEDHPVIEDHEGMSSTLGEMDSKEVSKFSDKEIEN